MEELNGSDGKREKRPQRLPYFSATEVAKHNVEEDCWVSFLGKVFDLTPLLAQNKGSFSCLVSPVYFAHNL